MKQIHVTSSHWPGSTPLPSSNNQNTQGATATAPKPPGGPGVKGVLLAAPTSWLADLPSNVFGDLIVGAIAQWSVAKSWLSKPVLFLPGLILSISLAIVILISIVFWPYGLVKQAAEFLFLYLVGLHDRYYLACTKPSEKVALALTMVVIGITDFVLAVIALPIFLGCLYLNWVALAPVTNTAISAGVVAGIALVFAFIILVLTFIVPILVCLVIVVLIAFRD